MNYEVTIKLCVQSPFDGERLAKRLRSAMDFGTVGEVLADAAEAEDGICIADIVAQSIVSAPGH